MLAWILFFRREDLLSIKPWLRKKFPSQTLSRNWDLFKSNLKTLLYFIRIRINSGNIEFVELPVYGQLSLPIHKGYKIFNFQRGVVTKIFDPDVNILSINSEIDHLNKISLIDFASSIRRWNAEQRWYEEDYVKGTVASAHRSIDSVIFLKAFYEEAAPCMKSLISFQRPRVKDLQAYIEELQGGLDISIIKGNKSYSKEADIFGNFVDLIIKRLKNEGNISVRLVFTHGDFCPANILNTKDGIRIVDWENAGPRSLLFDYYSYFFYRPVIIKNISVEKMSSELDQAFPVLISGLDLGVTIIENIYRRLFYIEYLSKLVERMLTDKRLNIMDYILKYIDAFSLFEQKCNDGTSSGQIQSVVPVTP